MEDFRSLLLVLPLFGVWAYPRLAGATACIASLMCLPLHLYLIAPGIFQLIFKGEYSVPAPTIFA
jgi:hypothetical protein